ncbi:MAG: phosphatase PAP2 family protein, partial [Clostridia bacterium]|nr:phosphatase PAP2 family protein [Clostridia bacterium]
MNYSLKQKCFLFMLVTVIVSMLMMGTVPAFADVVAPVETADEVTQETGENETEIVDETEPEGETEFVAGYDSEEYDAVEDAEILYQTYSESVTPEEQTVGDKLDAKFYDFDVAVYKVFGKIQNKVTLVISKLFTSIGDENFVIPVAAFSVLLCFDKKARKYGFALLFAIAAGTIIVNLILKPEVLRIRPYNTLQNTDIWPLYSKWYAAAGSLSESDYSFPSGHSNSAFEMATAMFLCCMADKKKRIAWIFPILALGTACSRIMVMVHYPTDVIAGSLAGIVAGVIGYLLALAACKICEKIKFIDKISIIKTKPVIAVVLFVVVLGISFGRLLTESNEEKCAYNVEYDCNNKARIDDEKYPAIDGENYCKIH